MNGMAPSTTAAPTQRSAGSAATRRPPAHLRWVATVTAIVVGASIGALWAGLAPAPEKPVSDVRLEATSYAGPNPFMPPVGEDKAGVVSPAGTEGTFSGDTPGLFAETADKPSCTGQGLVENLRSDQVKAGAWAQALGIEAADIETYVGTLNPVLLRSDTAVTEHGYAEGRYTAYPAVLQAGTAAFVNSFGEPTVKCFSGNPLTRPANYAQATYTGNRWQQFAPTRITYVKPTKVVINTYVYVDVDRGSRREHRSWCSEHPGSKYCDRPNPDRWCEEHPRSKHCDEGREDEHDGKHDGKDDEHKDGKDDGKDKDGKDDGKGGDGKEGKDGDGKDGDGKEGKGGDGKEGKGGDGKEGKDGDRTRTGENSNPPSGNTENPPQGNTESPPPAGQPATDPAPAASPCTGLTCPAEPRTLWTGTAPGGTAEGAPDTGQRPAQQGNTDQGQDNKNDSEKNDSEKKDSEKKDSGGKNESDGKKDSDRTGDKKDD